MKDFKVQYTVEEDIIEIVVDYDCYIIKSKTNKGHACAFSLMAECCQSLYKGGKMTAEKGFDILGEVERIRKELE